jgi:NAD(P)-dependent dehydrogenase (short-subunit alcohol dehydrogenase family)
MISGLDVINVVNGRQRTALVTGSSSGLGKALVDGLKMMGFATHPYDIKEGRDVLAPVLPPHLEELDLLVNCAGVNKIDWLPDVSDADWDAVMDVNAKGLFKMTQACLPNLKAAKGTVLNIVSNAAHNPMRCSAAYNASKGAALILTKQLARELASDGVTVFSVSPNKLAGTGMSKSIDDQVMTTRGWTKEQASEYQLAGLLAGEETDVGTIADFILFLLSTKQRHKYLAGCDIPYGA